MKDIYIKAWFGDWNKVSFQDALKFFRTYTTGAIKQGVKNTFHNHFKGVTYEEMLEGKQNEAND